MKNHIPSLNGLRTISILMVVGSHFSTHHFFLNNKLVKYFGYIFFNGPLGVSVFFVISGFLITTLLINEKENYGSISLKNFYARRTIRIFPAYYFLLFVYGICQMLGYLHFSTTEWLVNITYTKQFFPSSSYETSHLWSLSVEEFFYLLWPIIFIKSGKFTVKIILVLIVLTIVTRIVHYKYPIPEFSNSIFSTGDALLIGCLFAIKYDDIVNYIYRVKKLGIILFILLLFSVLTFSYLFYLITNGHMSSTKSYLVEHILMPFCNGLLGNIGLFTNLLIGLIVIYSINIKSIWYTFLNLPFMEYIGKLSYSIYLWQQLFTGDRSSLHKLPILLLVLFIFSAACFSYYVIEQPFLRFKARFNTFNKSKLNVVT
jgi:peptidoglycan/LPS O-acetylase OafA/YrhL